MKESHAPRKSEAPRTLDARTDGTASSSLHQVVLPLPLGLAQRSAKCRICGESFFNEGLPQGWGHDYREMIYPVHVILNFGEECAHAKCLERQNAEVTDK